MNRTLKLEERGPLDDLNKCESSSLTGEGKPLIFMADFRLFIVVDKSTLKTSNLIEQPWWLFDGDPDFHRLTFVLCCLQWPGLDLGKGRKLNSQHFVIDTALDVLAAKKTYCQKSFHKKRMPWQRNLQKAFWRDQVTERRRRMRSDQEARSR